MNKKSVFISGGSHGIGKDIAINFAKFGYDIYFFGRTKRNVNETHNYIKNDIGSYVESFVLDVLNKQEYDTFLQYLTKRNIDIDILINNVGGGGRWGGKSIIDTDINIWSDVYEKNVKPCIDLTKLFLPNMIKNQWGRVITISSRIGKESGGKPWFTMVKSSEISLMKELSRAKDIVRNNITFNTICPGAIYINDTGWDNWKEYNKKREDIPVGKLGKVSDISSMVIYLCGNYSGFINGSCITIDGGESVSF